MAIAIEFLKLKYSLDKRAIWELSLRANLLCASHLTLLSSLARRLLKSQFNALIAAAAWDGRYECVHKIVPGFRLQSQQHKGGEGVFCEWWEGRGGSRSRDLIDFLTSIQ